MQFSLKFSTSGTALSGLLISTSGKAFSPSRSCWFRARTAVSPALHVLRKAADRSGQPHRVGQVLGAGALLTLLLAAKVGRLERLCQTVAEVERPHALGRVDLVAAHRQRVDVGQLDGDPHPRLHRVHMDEGAAVLPLDLGGQALDLVPGADLVVDHHAGHEDGVPVHMRQHLVDVQRTVRRGATTVTS